MSRIRRKLGFGVAMIFVSGVFASTAESALPGPAKTVVLVHGAFADGSSWYRVIPILRQAGLKVIAVENSLDSLVGDVTSTRSALDSAEGPVVLVGHSWGGVVITEAGVHDKVKSLVYVAAYAPDAGQSLADAAKGYPDTAGQPFLIADAKGYLKFSDAGIFGHFAAGLPRAEQEVIAATQRAFNSAAATQPVAQAAWRKLPAFAVVAANDTIASPQMQRDQLKRMNARSVEIAASHIVMLTHPEAVARLIIAAAN